MSSSSSGDSTSFSPPSEETLRNAGGPDYTLREFEGGEDEHMLEEGSHWDMSDFDDFTTSVGHLYFHPGTRDPTKPIPPFEELQAFMQANPEAPVVVYRGRADGKRCEDPHLVFATNVTAQRAQERFHQEQDFGVSPEDLPASDNKPQIRLFTIAASANGTSFDPATHFKNNVQYEGVEIHNWGTVNFDQEYKGDTLEETFRKIYDELWP